MKTGNVREWVLEYVGHQRVLNPVPTGNWKLQRRDAEGWELYIECNCEMFSFIRDENGKCGAGDYDWVKTTYWFHESNLSLVLSYTNINS